MMTMPTADDVARAIVSAAKATDEDPITVAERGVSVKARHYAFHALVHCFPMMPRMVLCVLVGAPRDDTGSAQRVFLSFTNSHVIRMRSNAKRAAEWWDEKIYCGIIADIEARHIAKPGTPLVRPDPLSKIVDEDDDDDMPGPAPSELPRTPSPAKQEAPKAVRKAAPVTAEPRPRAETPSLPPKAAGALPARQEASPAVLAPNPPAPDQAQVVRFNGVVLDLRSRELAHRGRTIRIPRDDGVRLLAALARVMPAMLPVANLVAKAFQAKAPLDGPARLRTLVDDLQPVLRQARLEIKTVGKMGHTLFDLGD